MAHAPEGEGSAISIPTAGDIAQMTETAESLMIDTCTIVDPGGIVTTPSGGTEITDPVTYADVPCRRVKANTQAGRGLFSEQQIVTADYILAVPTSALLAVGWTVTTAGAVYTVTATSPPGSIGTLRHGLIVYSAAVGG